MPPFLVIRWTPRRALCAILAGLALSVFLCGYFYVYWRRADLDIVLVYQGFLFNDGRAQTFYDHTGYLYYLLLGSWYALLHAIGLLPVHAASALPPVSDLAAYEAAWRDAVRAGRVFSLLTACAYVAAFAVLVRKWLGDGRAAVFAAFALACAVATQARVLRPEMLSGGLVAMALLLALLAIQARAAVTRAALLALAGLCAALAMEMKVQAVIPLLAVPLMALAFGARADPARRPAPWALAGALAIAGAGAAYAAWRLVLRHGFEAATAYPPIAHLPDGLYQALFLLWPLACIAAYAAIWRKPASDTLAAAGALALGAGLGALVLLIRFQTQNVVAIAHPVEHMFGFAAQFHPEMGAEVTSGLGARLLAAIWDSIATHLFVFHPTNRPALIAEWFALGAMVVAWRRGERAAVAQAGILVLAAWGMDALFAVRSLKKYYLLFSDPFLILAAARMAAHFPLLWAAPKARTIALWAGIAAVLWAHVAPIRWALSKRQEIQACLLIPNYMPGVALPFCPSPK